MPSNTQQADRSVAGLNEQIDKLKNGAAMAAAYLNDNRELRATLEHLADILKTDPLDAVRMAIQYGRVKEALRDFEAAVEAVTELSRLRQQRDKLVPLTTEAARAALADDEPTIHT